MYGGRSSPLFFTKNQQEHGAAIAYTDVRTYVRTSRGLQTPLQIMHAVAVLICDPTPP